MRWWCQMVPSSLECMHTRFYLETKGCIHLGKIFDRNDRIEHGDNPASYVSLPVGFFSSIPPNPTTRHPKTTPNTPQAIYVMAVYVTQAATAYRLELPDGGVYAEQIARWWGSMTLGERFRGGWVFLEHKKSMHVFLNHKDFFPSFFFWCLFVCFFYLGGGK